MGALSDPVNVTSSVVQGSVLGPTLFNCYINKLASMLNSNIRLYADDCIIYRTIKSPEDKQVLQDDLNTINNWCNDSSMVLNVSKCNSIVFRKSRRPMEAKYYIGNTSNMLVQVPEVVYLGVTLAFNLSWDSHISSMVRKAKYALYSIQQNVY